MTYALQYIRSIIFVILMYVMMPIVGLLGFIPALINRKYAHVTCKSYCVVVFWLARHLCGLTYEIRGEVPTGAVVVAAKHQSFYDVLVLFYALDKATFVMKKELLWAPILGFYAKRIGVAAVSRSKKTGTVAKMVEDMNANRGGASQIIIYPQGTRVGPGIKKPYKVGAAVLAKRFERVCVPVAGNIGVFWPKRGFYRKPGVAVMEFLDPLPIGLSVDELTKQLEQIIEPNSNRLMAEAGFDFEAIAA